MDMESLPSAAALATEQPLTLRASTRNRKRTPVVKSPVKRKRSKAPAQPAPKAATDSDSDSVFVGESFLAEEAHSSWSRKAAATDDEEVKLAKSHYRSAKVDDTIYNIGDDVYVTAGENLVDYIGRITEFFEGVDGGRYFACRWFFRPQDTVISNTKLVKDHTHDPKRVFLSDERNDNDLDCIVSKVKIIQVDPKLDQEAKAQLAADADLYFDMSYTVPYSTFENITPGNCCLHQGQTNINENSGISFDGEANSESDAAATKATILDLYSGCGGMSTGLCLGAVIAGLQIETRWAVDLNTNACESFKYNHPSTEVRNEKVEDFLTLLEEWSVLCDKHIHKHNGDASASSLADEGKDRVLEKGKLVIDKLTAISYGGTKREKCIYFKVQWNDHQVEDSWEPMEKLRAFPVKIKQFVQEGHRRKILPLPGDVDVLCGGPPCQGLSGNNRHRKCDKPLDDDKNRQIVTFMDIVSFLKPKYVLMENVADILKLNGGSVGRYALSRLVALNYQSRMGLMVAGCYGLPQFRMRMFLWGALPTMVLPKYPLPQIDSVLQQSVVAYDENQKPTLKEALCLGDAISDLPTVSNDETADETVYSVKAETEFQRYIRLSRKEMLDYSFGDNKCPSEGKLLDHRPLKLNKDDYERVKQIPYQKAFLRKSEGNSNPLIVLPDDFSDVATMRARARAASAAAEAAAEELEGA
ncbi:DNA (cytosine-5)-methyltransferase 1-like [Triticum dicoccoides]|uniref:DNA (cytosine-5)-methyltransferase 1-like n=1 Tax=Triticum dicoccoides TaxID=85692 RepID=UPI001891D171|nr:DNA (cytosine-5)-methyltransferase 1-like [Triticum dicoccoides]